MVSELLTADINVCGGVCATELEIVEVCLRKVGLLQGLDVKT